MLEPYARRDRPVAWLANQILRLSSARYRQMLEGVIVYGLDSAARDVLEERPAPRPWKELVK